jgi:hypothetical protein
MPDGKACQFMARSSVNEPNEIEIRMLKAGAEASLQGGEVQDKVGGPRLIPDWLRWL